MAPPVKELPPPPPQPEPPTVNGNHTQPDPSCSSTPFTTPKKASTFRRLHPPRAPQPSSTLRPPGPQSRAPSSSSTITRQFDRSPPPPRSPSLHSRVPSINSIVSDARSNSNNQSPSYTPNSSLVATIQPALAPPQLLSASLSSSLSPSPVTLPPVSTSPLSATPPRSSAPYRPGFQPRGVCRDRTDEFSLARNAKHDATRIERTKLERRLEKLIHLHFPVQANEANDQKRPPIERRKSTFFDLDLSNLKNIDASDIWKGVVQSQALQGPKADIRGLSSHSRPFIPHLSWLSSCRTTHRTVARRRRRC